MGDVVRAHGDGRDGLRALSASEANERSVAEGGGGANEKKRPREGELAAGRFDPAVGISGLESPGGSPRGSPGGSPGEVQLDEQQILQQLMQLGRLLPAESGPKKARKGAAKQAAKSNPKKAEKDISEEEVSASMKKVREQLFRKVKSAMAYEGDLWRGKVRQISFEMRSSLMKASKSLPVMAAMVEDGLKHGLAPSAVKGSFTSKAKTVSVTLVSRGDFEAFFGEFPAKPMKSRWFTSRRIEPIHAKMTFNKEDRFVKVTGKYHSPKD